MCHDRRHLPRIVLYRPVLYVRGFGRLQRHTTTERNKAQYSLWATENRSVGGSIPPLGTILFPYIMRKAALCSWAALPSYWRLLHDYFAVCP